MGDDDDWSECSDASKDHKSASLSFKNTLTPTLNLVSLCATLNALSHAPFEKQTCGGRSKVPSGSFALRFMIKLR